MKAFGLELRKANSISNLYTEVDKVLAAAKIPVSGISGDVQMMTVAHALQKMIRPDGWFDVCLIDSCIKVGQIVIQAERMNIYRAIHCVHWNQMEPDYRQTIIAMILDDFRGILNPQP